MNNIINFGKWENSIHNTNEQKERIEASRDKRIVHNIIEYESNYAKFTDESGTYETTLNTCTCQDFKDRQLPCKHIYRLAFELNEKQDNNSNDNISKEDHISFHKLLDNKIITLFIIPVIISLFISSVMYNLCNKKYKTIEKKLGLLDETDYELGEKIKSLREKYYSIPINEIATEVTTIATTKTTETTTEAPPVSAADGMFKIGTDIPSGEYHLFTDYDEPGGMYVLSNDANQNDIISTDYFEESSYVSVSNGQYLKLSDCTAYLIK